MEVRCPSCPKVYRVDPAAIPSGGRKVRCKECGAVFEVHPPPPKSPAGTGASPPPERDVPGPGWILRTPAGDEEGVPLEDIRARIRRGDLTEEDLVLPPGGEEFLPASTVEPLGKWFRLRSRTAASPSPTAPPAAARGQAALTCTAHPDRPARWICDGCSIYYCDCTEWKEIQSTRVACCPRCGQPVLRVEAQKVFVPFWKEIPRVLTYPFRGNWWMFFLIGIVIKVGQTLGRFSGFGLFINLFLGACYLAMILHLIRESARGVAEMPEFPDVGNWIDGIVKPAFKAFLATLVMLGPFWIYIAFAWAPILAALVTRDVAPLVLYGLVGVGILLLGMAYYPMVIGIVAVWDTIVPAINPVVIFRLIGRIRGDYVRMLLIFYPLFVANAVFGILAGIAGVFFPVVPSVFSGLLDLYVAFTTAHLLGRMFYENEEALGWNS